MSFRTNEDNVYPVGSTITTRLDLTTKLVIKKYFQRIYYCMAVGDEAGKLKPYFERELVSTAK